MGNVAYLAQAKFPDHYDKPIKKVAKTKTELGLFTVVVFEVGTDWKGKPEYEIEMIYPDPEMFSTSTRKFMSIGEALKYGDRAADEAVAREKKEKREAKKSPARKTQDRLNERAKHFKKISGYDMEACRKLVAAVNYGEDHGWEVEWENDEMPDMSGIEDAKEVLVVVLRDENKKVIASMGGIADPTKPYSELVEAELMLEAMKRD